MSKHIFEAVDSTDDEMYFTIGVWPTLAGAVDAFADMANPNDLPTMSGHDMGAEVQVRRRELARFADDGGWPVCWIKWSAEWGADGVEAWEKEITYKEGWKP